VLSDGKVARAVAGAMSAMVAIVASPRAALIDCLPLATSAVAPVPLIPLSPPTTLASALLLSPPGMRSPGSVTNKPTATTAGHRQSVRTASLHPSSIPWAVP